MNTSIDIKNTTYEYMSDSIWSNIKYLVGMLAFIVIPPFIPGVTTRGLIFCYAGIVVGIYIMAFVIKLVLIIRLTNTSQTRRY